MLVQIHHFRASPPYPRSIANTELPYRSGLPRPAPEQTSDALIAELRTAKVEYLHAAVDALAAVELWLALDAWIPAEQDDAA